jgi:hypothetical protein
MEWDGGRTTVWMPELLVGATVPDLGETARLE